MLPFYNPLILRCQYALAYSDSTEAMTVDENYFLLYFTAKSVYTLRTLSD